MLFKVGAQQRISVAGGLHQSSVSPYWKLQPGASSQLMQHKGGFHLGMIADLPIDNLSGWSIQPAVFYSSKGAKQQQAFDPYLSKLTYYGYTQSLHYIDAPLNLVYKFPSLTNTSLILGGGPQASFYYSGSESFTFLDTLGNLTYDIKRDLKVGKNDQEYRVLHWGINLLAGVEFGNVFVTANFNKGLMPYLREGDQKFKHASFGVTLGFYLSGPKEEDRSARDRIYYCPNWW